MHHSSVQARNLIIDQLSIVPEITTVQHGFVAHRVFGLTTRDVVTISGLRTSLGMVRLMLALVACATTSGQALALSSACTTVNSGVYNKTNSVSFSDDLGTGFAAGETVTFVISGTGGTFYVDVDDVNTPPSNPRHRRLRSCNR